LAKKGDKLTDFITAGFYNDVVKKLGLKTGPTGIPLESQNHYVTVYNHSTTPREKWEAVSLGTLKLDYSDLDSGVHDEFAFNTKAFDGDDPHNLAILQEPLLGEVDATAQALIQGISWLSIPSGILGDSDNDYIKLTAITDLLTWAPIGRIEWIATGITDELFLVRIGAISSYPIQLRASGASYQISYDEGRTWESWVTGSYCSS
jgi:hypothetical protein